MLRTDCIDLPRRFRRQYVIDYEDQAFQGSGCPWHKQVRCLHGFVAPSKPATRLYALGRGLKIVKRFLDLAVNEPEAFRVVQGGRVRVPPDGDRWQWRYSKEIGMTFEAGQVRRVFDILQPMRR